MVASGHPHDQAVAASLRNAHYKRRGYAFGGVPSFGDLGSTSGVGGLDFGGMSNTIASMASPGAFANSWSSRGSQQPAQVQTPGAFGSGQNAIGAPAAPPPTPIASTPTTTATPPSITPTSHVAPLLSSNPGVSGFGGGAGGQLGGGGWRGSMSGAPSSVTRADGGVVPWFARNEARSMVHTGPIHSMVAGRTDHIPLKVAGGSYVLPADYVSHLGQNNTAAGHAKANLMFGNTGPFGSTITKGAHGRGAPNAPPAPRSPSSHVNKMHVPFSASGGKTFEGGVGGDEPIDIMAAGGEYVIHPDVVRNIGGGNIDHGHKILDRHVLQSREKHKKTLAKLPPPAK